VLFRSGVTIRVVRIRFSVWLVSGYAHVFVYSFSVVIVALPAIAARSEPLAPPPRFFTVNRPLVPWSPPFHFSLCGAKQRFGSSWVDAASRFDKQCRAVRCRVLVRPHSCTAYFAFSTVLQYTYGACLSVHEPA